MFQRHRFLASQIAFALILALLFGTFPASAFHFPWDQGHDTFKPDPPDEPDPEDDDCNKSGSPFEVATGNFFYSITDLDIDGIGPALEITRTYNSRDKRNGPFGFGWSSTFDQRLVEATDGIALTTICRQEDGKRERFRRNADGSYAPPGDFPLRLQKNADGSHTLLEPEGLERRFNPQGLLASVTDRNGNAVQLSYDATGFLQNVTDTFGRTLTFTKGADGKIASITDPKGRIHRYGYDAEGRLIRHENPAGGIARYSYDTRNRLTQILAADGTVLQQLAYDSSSRVASYLENGERWTVSYDTARRITTKRDSANNAWALHYNENGNVFRTVDPTGGISQTIYDASFRVLSETEANGGTTSFTYDARGNTTSVTGPVGNVTEYRYAPDSDQVVEIVQPGGRTTRYTYDERGNVAGVQSAVGNSVTLQYDVRGNVIRLTDANGQSHSFSYDANGFLASIVEPTGAVTTLSHDEVGNLLAITDPENRTLRFEYDEIDRPTRLIDPEGNATTYGYIASCPVCESHEQVTSITGPAGDVITNQYDALGRLTRVVDALGNSAQRTYDGRGNLASSTDGNGRTTTYTYDALRRLTRLVETGGRATEYAYDRSGNVTGIKDPMNVSTTLTYDLANRLRHVSSPDIGSVTATYNEIGKLATKTDSSGLTSTFSYDGLGRVTGIRFSDPADDIELRYDENTVTNGKGNLTGMSDPGGDTSYHYDPVGRLTAQVSTHLGTSYTSRFGYASGGELGQITYPSGLSVFYSFDSRGLLERVTAQTGEGTAELVSGITYDHSARRTVTSFGNGSIESRSYDSAGRPASIVVSGQMDLRYSYDRVGNILAIQDAAQPSRGRTFSYDADDQLIAASGAWGTVSYTYDLNGNRLQEAGVPGTTVYNYSGNRLTQASGAASASMTYDGHGRVLSDGTFSYSYDQGGRLSRVMRGGTEISVYTYNGRGQRVVKKAGGAVTIFHYDAMGRLIEESDAAGVPLNSYIYLPDGTPLGLIQGGALYYYLVDHLDTPQKLIDHSGNVVWSADMLPFGMAFGDSGNVQQRLRFAGQYYDEETGLHYNWNRYYSPVLGRYLEPDPVGLEAGLNLFVYAGNNPVKYVDPTGLTWTTRNFVGHYYIGGGLPIDLSAVGLLGAFRNAPSVKAAVGSFKQKAESEAISRARKLCKKCDKGTKTGSFKLSDKTVTDVTNVPNLFAVGHSTFYRDASCDLSANCKTKAYKYSCTLGFKIRDWFRDPLSMGFEVGGTPYQINASWSEKASGSGGF